MSLRRRFVLVFVAFSVTLTALGGWAAWEVTRNAIESEIDQKLLSTAQAAVAVGIQASDFHFPNEQELWDDSYVKARLQSLEPYFVATYLIDQNGVVGGSWVPAGPVPIGATLDLFRDVYRDDLDKAYQTGEAVTRLLYDSDGDPYKYVITQIESSGIFFVGRAKTDFRDPLVRFRNRILGVSILAVLVAAFLAWRLATGVVQPIGRLSRAAMRIQRGRLDRPVKLERADELGQLSRAMDRMRLGILERDEQLRLMLAQVAHEIRNPLGGVELFATAAAETDEPHERARLLSRIREEVSALEGIISEFLSYARPVQPAEGLTDIRGPLLEAAELVESELVARGGTLECDLPSTPLVAAVHPDQVKRIVLNLLRNAAQAGDHVRIAARWINGEVLLSVRDDGPGVPEELRERIFEPFVTDKEKGAGLGLAIVRQVAEANGGRAELSPDPPVAGGGGAEFHVYFRGAEELPPDDLHAEPTAEADAMDSTTLVGG